MQPDAQRTQKDRRQKLSFADAHVEQVLLVVLKLDPGAAIRNDLGNVNRAAFEEDPRRAVQLGHDYALSSVDNESAVVSHQRNFAKEDFFFLDVANRFYVRVRIFVVDGQPDLYFERHAIAHAALLTLLLIMFVLESDGLAAVRAKFRTDVIEGAAHVTECLAGPQRIDFDTGLAILARRAQVFQSFQIAALALPIADLIFDKVERRGFAKVGDRKHRLKDRLKTSALALFGQQIHLQKTVIRFPLNLDQIRNRHRRLNFRKVVSLRRLTCASPQS